MKRWASMVQTLSEDGRYQEEEGVGEGEEDVVDPDDRQGSYGWQMSGLDRLEGCLTKKNNSHCENLR